MGSPSFFRSGVKKSKKIHGIVKWGSGVVFLGYLISPVLSRPLFFGLLSFSQLPRFFANFNEKRTIDSYQIHIPESLVIR